MPTRKTWPEIRKTRIEVSLGRLSENLKILQGRAPKSKMLVLLKANAYGLGAVALAKFFSARAFRENIHGFGVANVEEGLELRGAGIKAPILVLSGIQNYSKPLHLILQQSKLTPVISSFPVFLQAIEIFKKIIFIFPKPI